MSNKPIVLIIHGMGTHSEESVKDEFKVGLHNCMEFFGKENFNVNDHFTIKTFNYSENWDKKRKLFAKHLQGNINESLSLTPALIKRIIEVTAEFDGDDFLHTHVLDVLFYLTGTLRGQELSKLHEALGNEIEANINDLNNQPLIVISHSLGTSFIHDCLTQLYTSRLNPIKFGLDQLWSIATVSRLTHLISRMDDPNNSIVTDHSPVKAGVCKIFYPVYNELDPFCWFKRYQRIPNEGLLINTKHVRDLKKIYGDKESLKVNPHDLREYFSDPEVGGRFLSVNGILDISIGEFTKAQNLYRKTTITGDISTRVKAIKDKLIQLDNVTNNASGIRKKITILLDVYEIINEIRDEYKFFED